MLDSTPTICIVGNAYSIKNSKLGEIIDSHTHVVRFNDYETEDYKVDVGEKTTHWAMTIKKGWHYSKLFNQGDLETIERINSLDEIWVRRYQIKISDKEQKQRLETIYSCWEHQHLKWIGQEYLQECGSPYEDWQQKFLDNKPPTTTGLLAIILAIHRWRLPISIVGFGYSAVTNYAHYHKQKSLAPVHSLSDERDLVNKWIKQGMIKRLEEE